MFNTQNGSGSMGTQDQSQLYGSSKNGTELFAQINSSNAPNPQVQQPPVPASSDSSQLSGHRRERYEEGTVDAAFLTVNSNTDEMVNQSYPTKRSNGTFPLEHLDANVIPPKFGFDPRKDSTASLQTGHVWKTEKPEADPRYPNGQQFPVAVGYCLRGCGTHCNSETIKRTCSNNNGWAIVNGEIVRYVNMRFVTRTNPTQN